MADHEIFQVSDLQSLTTLPRLSATERAVLERLLLLAPDVALSTAAAVVRTNQPDLHELLFGRGRGREAPDIGKLARALVYLGLAIAAPKRGKILPILSQSHLGDARRQVPTRLAMWGQAGVVGGADVVERDAIPDPELRVVLDALIERFGARAQRDPRWLRAEAFSEAGALYAVLGQACREQFGGAVDLASLNSRLNRLARTGDLIADVLAADSGRREFSPTRQNAFLERLRRFGWEERVTSRGRTLSSLALDAAARGFRSSTSFALTEEWLTEGASAPTDGRRYFIRPSLLPDSGGLAFWAQEERLKPLQKMLAGDPVETGLRLILPSAELLLEYIVETRRRDFLDGHWTRTSNHFGGLQTRLGGVTAGEYSITIFPGARLDPRVGICPIVEVHVEAPSASLP